MSFSTLRTYDYALCYFFSILLLTITIHLLICNRIFGNTIKNAFEAETGARARQKREDIDLSEVRHAYEHRICCNREID